MLIKINSDREDEENEMRNNKKGIFNYLNTWNDDKFFVHYWVNYYIDKKSGTQTFRFSIDEKLMKKWNYLSTSVYGSL